MTFTRYQNTRLEIIISLLLIQGIHICLIFHVTSALIFGCIRIECHIDLQVTHGDTWQTHDKRKESSIGIAIIISYFILVQINGKLRYCFHYWSNLEQISSPTELILSPNNYKYEMSKRAHTWCIKEPTNSKYSLSW